MTLPRPTPPSLPPPPSPPPEIDEDNAHFVYATVAVDRLVEVDGDASPLATRGERVLLVYPMRTRGEEELITMRLKRCNPRNGQLSYHWVVVYDNETASVTDFSLLP